MQLRQVTLIPSHLLQYVSADVAPVERDESLIIKHFKLITRVNPLSDCSVFLSDILQCLIISDI